MLHAYWLLAGQRDKRAAARILKVIEGFIGFYPGSLDKDCWLVAIFDSKVNAESGKTLVEASISISPIGNVQSSDLSYVCDCRSL